MNLRMLALALGALVLAGPATVAAIRPASAAPGITADSDDARYAGVHDLQGVVTYSKHHKLHLRAGGQEVFVRLHKGTVIHPTGLTLIPGLVVNVHGHWLNGIFFASRIALVH